MLALERLRGLVVIDEVQRLPELFSALRVLVDRKPLPARFLVLGSAAPELLRQSSESLAGRILHYPLGGISLDEVRRSHLRRLWVRGGFPRSYLARSAAASFTWRFEIKRTSVPRVTRSMHVALSDLSLEGIDVIHAGRETFPLAPKIRAVPLSRILQDVAPLI